MTPELSARPRLAQKARLRFDPRERRMMLISPERGLILNGSAARVLELCDGTRSIAAIVDVLHGESVGTDRARISHDVLGLIERLRARTLVELIP